MVCVECPQRGHGYTSSCNAGLLAGKYGYGSPEWQEANDAWLNSESEQPYPEDLKQVDGHGYKDSIDAATS